MMLTALVLYTSTIMSAIALNDLSPGRNRLGFIPLVLSLLTVASLYSLNSIGLYPAAAITLFLVLAPTWPLLPARYRLLITVGLFTLCLLLGFKMIAGINPLALPGNTPLEINTGKLLVALLLGVFLVNISRHRITQPHRSRLQLTSTASALILVAIIGWYVSQKDAVITPGLWARLAINLIVTACAEELFFRGFLLNTQLRFMTPTTALYSNALLFALVHVPHSVLLAGFAFIAGLLYGAVYLLSGKILPAVLVHWVVNIPLLLYIITS